MFSQNLSAASRDKLRGFIGVKYSAEAKYLNLEGCCEQLQEALGGLASFQNSRFVQEILAIISDNCPDVKTINLSGCGIDSLVCFRPLSKVARGLANLCFSNNNIASLSELDNIRGYADTLHELILAGNPCAGGTSLQMYQHRIRQRFPKLALLDGQPPKPVIQFDLPAINQSTDVPKDCGSFFDDGSTQQTVTAFVNQYFPLYDSNRQGLLQAYSKNACFSVSVSRSVRLGHLPEPYTTNSRNFLRHSSTASTHSTHSSSSSSADAEATKAAALLQTTPLHIVYKLDSMPRTQHNLADFIADSLVLPTKTSSGGENVLQVCVAGTFTETDTNTLREFHRVFLIVPSSPADNSQWPAVILNDQLYIHEAPPTTTAPTASSPSLNPAAAAADGMSAQQQAMVRQLSQQAQVDANIASQALNSNSWVYEQAFANIQQLRQQQQQQLAAF